MINRVKDIAPSIPITVMYGMDSWMMKLFDFSRVKSERPGAFVDIKAMKNAGHHIYVDQKDEFNNLISDICNMVENSSDESNVEQTVTALDEEEVHLLFLA